MSIMTGTLEAYRTDTYGKERSDFGMCESALNACADTIALVRRAIAEISVETKDNEHAQVLTAAHDALRGVLDTMNAALTVLTDCEVSR